MNLGIVHTICMFSIFDMPAVGQHTTSYLYVYTITVTRVIPSTRLLSPGGVLLINTPMFILPRLSYEVTVVLLSPIRIYPLLYMQF
jgi:hypothetical protein